MEPVMEVYKMQSGHSHFERVDIEDGSYYIDGVYWGLLGAVRVYSQKDKYSYTQLSTGINGYTYYRTYERVFTERGLEMKAALLLKNLHDELQRGTKGKNR